MREPHVDPDRIVGPDVERFGARDDDILLLERGESAKSIEADLARRAAEAAAPKPEPTA